MDKIIIRTGGNEDVALIAEISRTTFYDTFIEQNSKEDMDLFMKNNFNLDAITAEISDPSNTFLIASINDDVAGYAKVSEGTAVAELEGVTALEISRIYVVKEKIGSGVGKALINRCIEVAKEKGKQSIWLGVWEHNARAIAFYEKIGFQKFSEHQFLLGNDVQNDWLMKKEL